MPLMLLGALAAAWAATMVVVVALCVTAARADRADALRRAPARSRLRMIA